MNIYEINHVSQENSHTPLDLDFKITDGLVMYVCLELDIDCKMSDSGKILIYFEEEDVKEQLIQTLKYYKSNGYFSSKIKNIDKINEILLLWNGDILWENEYYLVGKMVKQGSIYNVEYSYMTDIDEWMTITLSNITLNKLPQVILKTSFDNFEENMKSVGNIIKLNNKIYLAEILGLHDIYDVVIKYYNIIELNQNILEKNLSDQQLLINFPIEILYMKKETYDGNYLIGNIRFFKKTNKKLLWSSSIVNYFNLKSVF